MSAFVFKERKEKKRANINLTSLIDVLFLLVIFFMLTGTFKRVGELELHLPGSSTSVPSTEVEESRQAELVITETGHLFLDGAAVEMAGLKGRLTRIIREDPQSRVMIKAEKGVEHGRVVMLLDIVRSAGFAGVGIGTYMESSPEQGAGE